LEIEGFMSNKYYQKNKEYWKKYSEENKEMIKEQRRKHYQKNKEKIREQRRIKS